MLRAAIRFTIVTTMWRDDALPEDLEALLRGLPFLPGNAEVTITIRASDLAYGIVEAIGGPEIMGTSQAERYFGFSHNTWRKWAANGMVEDAWQDPDGRWRLPKSSCHRLAHSQRMAAKSAIGRPWRRRGPYAKAAASDFKRMLEDEAEVQGTTVEEERERLDQESRKIGRAAVRSRRALGS